MNPLSVPCVGMGGLNLYLAAYHLLMHVRRPQAREQLPFALLCFSVVGYNLGCIGLYNATTLAQGIFWQRIQLTMVGPVALCNTWFVSIVAGQDHHRLIRFFKLWFAVLSWTSLLDIPSVTLSNSTPSIKLIRWGTLPIITYHESSLGLLTTIYVASTIVAYVTLFVFLVRYRRDTPGGRSLGLLASQSAYCVGVVNDSLVAAGVYPFVYVSEYAFFLVVLAMALRLANQFIDLHSTVENVNLTLEKRVAERTGEILRLNQELQRLADMDPLTGVYNRRFFDRYIEIELRRARNQHERRVGKLAPSESDMNFGLAMIDIDDFKAINDRYGHPAGDRVLQETVATIREHIFSRDVLCRYGGEEFALILTNTVPDGLVLAAEKIRRAIAERCFHFDSGTPNHVTVSIGVASFDEVKNEDPMQVIALADTRLYAAKSAGKNRVVFADRSTATKEERR